MQENEHLKFYPFCKMRRKQIEVHICHLIMKKQCFEMLKCSITIHKVKDVV